ncbi:unnamed protein product [Orchesella dallaii]|uniref:Odorant receptor n=1 Tax=Orchesella dallaii TaxID=48710 RepID=A0ABP1RGW5_9HEXA
MLSQKVIDIFGLRVQLMVFGGGNLFGWDKPKKQLSRAHNYYIFNMLFGIYWGFWWCAALALRLYLILTAEPEYDGEKSELTLKEFGSNAILVGEIILCSCLMFLVIVSTIHLDDFVFLMNQLFVYNNAVLDMMKSKNIELSLIHRRNMLLLEVMTAAVCVVSAVLPFGLAAAIFHPMEPTHRMVLDWFEIEIKLEGFFILWYILTCVAMLGCGNIVAILANNIAFYFIIFNTCIKDLTAEEMGQRHGVKRCQMSTQFYELMEDNEIATAYRIQKLFNILINNFYSSVLVSFHHVAMLAVASIMLFFFIKFQDIVWEGGLLVEAFVLGTIIVPLWLINVQAIMCGKLVDASGAFKFRARKLVHRKTFLAKFGNSCTPFYIQVVYPFYTVHKETFADFCSQAIDYTITLLLW